MDIRKLQRAIVDGLEDVKALDIQVFNTERLSPLFERVIVAAGASNRQTKALASSVREAVRAAGLDVLRTEGEENGEWIIVDCGAAVAHIMQPSIRDYYRLEEIWGGKPVAIKLGGGRTGLVKASEGADDEDEAPRPKKRAKAAKAVELDDGEAPARKKPAAKKAAPLPRAKTPAERSSSTRGPVAKKTSARAAAATKPAGTQAGKAKPAPKSVAGKVAAAKKTRAGSTAARAGAAPAKTAKAPSVKKIVVPVNSSRNAATAAKKTAKKTAATKAAVARKVAARRG